MISASLTELGLFRELGCGDDGPNLHSARRGEPWPDQEHVVADLRAAPPVTISPGIETDVFNPE